MLKSKLNTHYVNLSELNIVQTKIMECINKWVHEEKTPISLKEIFIQMGKEGVKRDTIIHSVKILIKFRFIRRTIGGENSKVAFVQLRTI
jgi:hypothetical protein